MVAADIKKSSGSLTGWRKVVCWRGGLALHLFAAALALWLLAPALMPVHVEGFSASIQSIGIHMAGGDLPQFDRLFPLNQEFYTTSRIGMNLLVAALYRLAPVSADWPMRVAMALGLLCLVGASVVLIRRWSGVHARTGTLAALGALLLMPGVSESAFFYNDNLLGAGLAAVSLALVAAGAERKRWWWLTALAGGAFAAATLVRADSVLLAPAVILCLLHETRSWRRVVAAAAVFGAAAVLLIWAVPGSLGFSFFDTMAAANREIELWERPRSALRQGLNICLLLGIPGLLLAGLGVHALVRQRAWLRLALLVGVPAFYNLGYFGAAWQIRQLLPITPFLGALVVIGGVSALGLRTRLKRDLFVGLALCMLYLPAFTMLADGPRAMVGRLWMPILWFQWQDVMRTDSQRMDALIAGLHGNSLVITDNWDADRYLHLRLQQAGYRAIDETGLPSDCSRGFETFRQGDTTVRHLRLHTPALLHYWLLADQRHERYQVQCPARVPPVATFYFGTAWMARIVLGENPSSATDDKEWLPSWVEVSGVDLLAIALDDEKLARLRAMHKSYAEHLGRRYHVQLTLEQAERLVQPTNPLFLRRPPASALGFSH